MPTTAPCSVLFARLIPQAASPEESVARGLDALARVAEAAGARVLKRLPEKLMVVAESPEAAADAAAEMHAGLAATQGLALGVGFHHGSVIRHSDDVHGRTVNLAARLADRAAGGTILTTEATAQQLGMPYRNAMRHLGALKVKGVSEDLELCELLWREDADATLAPARRPSASPAPRAMFSVLCDGEERHFPPATGEILIGRDPGCDLVVSHPLASRRHCTVERRDDRYVLTDHSANGTWVTVQGREMRLHREDLVLGRQGKIALGRSGADGGKVLRFACV